MLRTTLLTPCWRPVPGRLLRHYNLPAYVSKDCAQAFGHEHRRIYVRCDRRRLGRIHGGSVPCRLSWPQAITDFLCRMFGHHGYMLHVPAHQQWSDADSGFPLGFFVSGTFSPIGSFFTELFPSRLRGSGQGFSYNFGRGVGALFQRWSVISRYESLSEKRSPYLESPRIWC